MLKLLTENLEYPCFRNTNRWQHTHGCFVTYFVGGLHVSYMLKKVANLLQMLLLWLKINAKECPNKIILLQFHSLKKPGWTRGQQTLFKENNKMWTYISCLWDGQLAADIDHNHSY